MSPTRQDFDTVDVLRLEVEVPPSSGLVNLVPNPDGALGGWGWLTPASGSRMTGTPSGGLTYNAPIPAAAASWWTTEPIAVAAGQYVAAEWTATAAPAPVTTYRARFEWLNAAGVLLSSSTQGAAISSDAAAAPSLAAVQAPANTAYVRLRFDQSANPPAEAPIRLTNVRLATASTAAALAAPITLVSPWVNILGPSHSIEIDRAGLDVGTLEAEILDAALDPSQSSQLRPGRRVRCTVKQPDNSWSPIYTGKADRLAVEYDEKAQPPKPPRVTLSAVDGITNLATPRRSQGVSTIDELPFLLEGAGVPWDTNGSGNQITSAVAVAVNDNATALDQVAITRDTRLGSAWVDRRGVLRVYDRVAAPVLDGLTVDGGTFDDPASVDVNGYVWNRAPLNATAAHVTTPAKAGAGALRLTATGSAVTSGYMGVQSLAGMAGMPIVGGRTYTVTASFRAAAVTGRVCRLNLYGYKGNTLSQGITTPYVTSNTSGWTTLTHTFTAAPGMKFFSLTVMIEGVASGEVHYVDEVSVTLERRNPLVIDEARYSDLNVSFSTADLINSVNVKRHRLNGTETIEETFGSYEDAASVKEWGRRSATFTVQGLADAEIAPFGAAVLARNAVPIVRPNSAVMPVKVAADLSTTALVDLYDEPSVRYAAKGIDKVLAITRVRHRIEPEKWLVEVEFGKQEGVAAPNAVPVLSNEPDLGVPDGVWQNYTITTPTKGAGIAPGYVYRYTLVGDTVTAYFRGRIASTLDTGPIAIPLPVPARAGSYDVDTVTGTAIFHNPGIVRASGLIGMGADGVPGGYFVFWKSIGNNDWVTTPNFPGGGASGDEIVTAFFSYERQTP